MLKTTASMAEYVRMRLAGIREIENNLQEHRLTGTNNIRVKQTPYPATSKEVLW